MADVESSLATVATCQTILSTLTALALTAYQYPQTTSIANGTWVDMIVIGSGAGGATVANRLSENENTTVALFECGDVPRVESRLPGIFTLQPNSGEDWNTTARNNSYSCQNVIDGIVEMTAGKGLGGTSILDHMIWVRGAIHDFQKWAEAAGDDSWLMENFMEYFKKSENCLAEDIMEEYASYHGTSGPLGLTRQTSDYNVNILEALAEIGIPQITDITGGDQLGACEPLLLIANSYRQSAAETYLHQAKNRSNLLVQMNTCVTKILLDSNNTAIGVEAINSDGETITVYAKKEVILSAGAVKTVQVLANSGIGPAEQLEAIGVDTILDLPVGKQMFDHIAVVLAYTLGDGEAVTVSNPHEFPVPMTTAYAAYNKSQDYPDYQTINLFFPPESAGLLQLCRWVFKLSDDICQTMYDANKKANLLFVVHNMMHPVSLGSVTVTSTDITENPKIEHGIFTNETDLINMGKYLLDFAPIINTTYFKSVNSTLVNLQFTKCTDYDVTTEEFWQCHALEMGASMWHYSGTAAMGTVTDGNMTVIGTKNLRVVSAATIPYIPGGNIIAPIYAMAEKVSDLIKERHNLS